MSVLGLIPTAGTFSQRILTLRLIFQGLLRRFWTVHTPVTISRKFWAATCFACSVTSSEPATTCRRPLPSSQTEKQKTSCLGTDGPTHVLSWQHLATIAFRSGW